MPEVGNDKNATVERGGFSAVQNALIGPLRHFAATQQFGRFRMNLLQNYFGT
jgi:hypothetical protein